MVGFLIKKSFWDYWDRMGIMFLINVGYLFLLVGAFLSMDFAIGLGWLFNIVIFAFLVLLSLYSGMAFGVVYELVEGKSFYWHLFPQAFQKSWLKSLLFAVIGFGVFMLITIAFNFYRNIMAINPTNSMFPMVAFFMLVWLMIFLSMAVVWFFPLLFRMKDPLLKHLKKCFILAMDNVFLSLFLLIWGMMFIPLSIVTLLIVTGPSALIVLWQNGLKLLMYKYDYLEENSGAKRIPWNVLLLKEKEKMGKRGISDLIRPGKL